MKDKSYSLFVISLANPILVGLYENDKLIIKFSNEGKTSDVLPSIIQNILKKYKIKNIIYVNGPGSYMAIKIAYIFLKTICIVNKINFFACSGFDVNNNSPIKALGKKYFIKDKDNKINISLLNDCDKLNDFILPNNIDISLYSKKTLPVYNLPAVN